MDVTCVIPAFERVDLLARCLASVAAQTGVSLEIIVTDDSGGSAVRDYVASIAKLYPQMRYVEGPRGGNPVDNWNLGLDLGRGDFSLLVHHDEFLVDPDYLRRAVERLRRTGAPAAVGGVRVTGVTRPSRFALAGVLARGLGRPRWLLPALNWIGPTAAFVFRAGPRFDRTLVQLVDVEFYGRVLGGGRLEILEGVCVGSLGHHDGQITAGIDPGAAARRELRELRRRRPPAMGVIGFAACDAVLGLRSWRR